MSAPGSATGHDGLRLAGQALAGAVGLACAALALWLALHHPLWPVPVLAGVVVLAAAQAIWPPLWLVALPALLPWLGWGAWTGWLMVEEIDLAVLAVAAGSHLRWMLAPGPRQPAGRASRAAHRWGGLLLLLWTASAIIALHLGVQQTGGWAAAWNQGWWQGLREPLNALRLAKPTLAVLLLLPLWWRLQQRPDQRCAELLTLGMSLCLAGVALWCIYERLAFPGLLNMSEDYRTTGPFWETHVGGAALDAILAMTVPFALQLALQARRPAALAASMLVLLAGAYAGLTTFSRIVYLALPAGALLVWWLRRSAPASSPASAPGSPAAIGAAPAPAMTLSLLVLALGTASLWLFPAAGYRGLLALLGSTALLLLLLPYSTGQRLATWIGAGLGGLLLGIPLWLLAPLLPKGAYLVYAGLTLLAAALFVRGAPRRQWALAGALFVAQLGSGVGVALAWGGTAALPAAGATLAVLALGWVLAGRLRQPPWPPGIAWPARGLAALTVVLAGVAVFGGGAYMATRLSQTETDRAGRWQHWKDGLALSGSGAGFWLGQGLGRYPDLYAVQHDPATRPGDLRLVPGETGPMVRTVAGNHLLGRGELLRLSQRLATVPDTGLRLVIELRMPARVKLRIELCAKHLLYDDDCRALAAHTRADEPGWQTLTLNLPDAPATAGAAVPRWQVLSVASETHVHPVEIRRLRLLDANGRDWLHNGDFQAGGARWFVTSDRNHLPWHAKNMAVHVAVEQGAVGLALLLAWGVAALAALLGPLRRHPLAPPLAGALVGVWIVGGVDSVLDMPRTATWVLLLHAMALALFVRSRARRPA